MIPPPHEKPPSPLVRPPSVASFTQLRSNRDETPAAGDGCSPGHPYPQFQGTRTKMGGRESRFPDAEQWRGDCALSEHKFKQIVQSHQR